MPEDLAPGRNSTADRAIDLLLLFDEQHPVLPAAEVSRRLGMPRSTTYRYLQTLRAAGLVEEDAAHGGFRLGPRIFHLARVARVGLGLSEIALPVMRRLAEQTGEVVLLTRHAGTQVICVERIDPGAHTLRLSYERGHLLPPHAGASAKILLAYAEPAEVDRLLAAGTELPRYTERTVTDPARLRAQLTEIRAAGVAVTDGEVDPGVRGVAAPVFLPDGRVVGLSVAGPEFRLEGGALREAIEAVRDAAEVLTRRLREVEA